MKSTNTSKTKAEYHVIRLNKQKKSIILLINLGIIWADVARWVEYNNYLYNLI